MQYNLLPRLLLATSAFTVISGQAIANTGNKADFKSGFYLGQSFNFQSEKQTLTVKHDNKFPTPQNSFKKKSDRKFRVLPELYVGYRHYWNQVFIGAEIAAAFGESKITLTAPGAIQDFSNNKIKSRYHFKPSVHLGMCVLPSVTFFVKGGLDIENFEASIRTADELIKHQDKTSTGFTIGSGAECHISEKFATRFELELMTKKTIRFGTVSDTFNDYHRKLKKTSAATKLGLIYKF